MKLVGRVPRQSVADGAMVRLAYPPYDVVVAEVDGRCRIGQKTDPNNTIGEPECVEGTFYMNSVRPQYGAELDSWFDEVIDYVDQNYRTAPPSDVNVIE